MKQHIRYDSLFGPCLVCGLNILAFIITFLGDNVKKGLISINLCATKNQIIDIFTKALSREQFEKNMLELGLIKIT